MSAEYPLPSMTHLLRRLQNSDVSEIWTGMMKARGIIMGGLV
jgi:hypothetical protein